MRLFVTGGTGYLGTAVVKWALKEEMQVAATAHHQPPHTLGVAWFPLDIRDSDKLTRAMTRFRPDVVIHTAYIKSGSEMWSVNVEGTAHVAQAAQNVGARMIHLSTDLVFDGRIEGQYREEDTPNPVLSYGQAKLEAEQRATQIAPESTIIRTSLIWGLSPIDPTTQFVLDLASGRQNGVLFFDEYRSFTYVDDLARGLLELTQIPHTGILHMGGAQPLSRVGFGRIMAAHFGLDREHLPTGSARDFPAPRPLNCVLDSSRASRLLKTRLRGVREVLNAGNISQKI